MSKKFKYRYNPESLEYERVKTPLWINLARIFGFISASIVFGILFLWISYSVLDSPKERKLRREIRQYEAQLDIMNERLEEMSGMVASLEERDDKIYREIFGAPMPKSIRTGGVGGTDRYAELKGYSNTESLTKMASTIDQLSRKMLVQSRSYDELVKLAKAKADMLASIPAIQPISNKELRRMASGYGYRIDPIYKTRKFHKGMDFTAPSGTKIYATGDGVVKEIERKQWGYGQSIVLNHGFGYQTRYAHLSKSAVKPGQKVKRGELIGYVGSSGKSTAPHLHYEVLYRGDAVNPVNFYYNDLSPEQYETMLEIASHSNQAFD
jgi:murein DD-endopeptidase MepM/ murein hydrolase activator NlpD